MNLWGDPALSGLLAGGYITLLGLMWSLLFFGVPRYGARWRLPEPGGEPPEDGPMLSVCIPARNEAQNIQAAVEAALQIAWPRLEVIVVDDRSEDGTGQLARDAGADDPRLRVIGGTEPQSGWAGKPWACARAGSEARGDLLLFLDADVKIHPDAPRALIDELERHALGMLSAFGTWELLTFWERAVVPTVGWLIRGAVDLDTINDQSRSEAFANGQLILFRRTAYEQIGGHEVVQAQILEDVRIAEAVKQNGIAIGMRVAPWLFRVRLYRNLSEIVGGYSKNLYEGMGRRPIIGFGAILFILVGTLFPFGALFVGILGRLSGWGIPGNGWLVALTGVCAAQLAFRWRIERFDGRGGGMAWVHPLANIVLVWILLRSILGLRATWKGRVFVDGCAVSSESADGGQAG